MNLRDIFAKLGILRFGAKKAVWHSGRDMPAEMLMKGKMRRIRRPPEIQEPNSATLLQLHQQQACNEIPGDDVENVHSDESARRAPEASVEQNHKRNGHGPQAVYFGSISQAKRRLTFC